MSQQILIILIDFRFFLLPNTWLFPILAANQVVSFRVLSCCQVLLQLNPLTMPLYNNPVFDQFFLKFCRDVGLSVETFFEPVLSAEISSGYGKDTLSACFFRQSSCDISDAFIGHSFFLPKFGSEVFPKSACLVESFAIVVQFFSD